MGRSLIVLAAVLLVAVVAAGQVATAKLSGLSGTEFVHNTSSNSCRDGEWVDLT